MPFLQVDDAPAPARPWDPGAAARLHSSAQHPSSRGPAPRLVNIRSPYQALEAPADATWPRATVRPTPLLDGPGNAWAAKIWAAQGVPAKKNGVWVTKTGKNLGEVLDWAAVEVERRRPKSNTDPSAGDPVLTATSLAPVDFRIEPVTDPVGLDWRERAACAGYPHKKGEVDPFDKSDDDPKWEVGKSFCNLCPVRAECLEDALEQEGWRDLRFRSGLRGGLTPRERVNLKHRTASRDRRQGSEAA